MKRYLINPLSKLLLYFLSLVENVPNPVQSFKIASQTLYLRLFALLPQKFISLPLLTSCNTCWKIKDIQNPVCSQGTHTAVWWETKACKHMVSAQHDMRADVVGCLCSGGNRDGLTHLGQAIHSSVESLRMTQIHTEPITISVNKNLAWKKALMRLCSLHFLHRALLDWLWTRPGG